MGIAEVAHKIAFQILDRCHSDDILESAVNSLHLPHHTQYTIHKMLSLLIRLHCPNRSSPKPIAPRNPRLVTFRDVLRGNAPSCRAETWLRGPCRMRTRDPCHRFSWICAIGSIPRSKSKSGQARHFFRHSTRIQDMHMCVCIMKTGCATCKGPLIISRTEGARHLDLGHGLYLRRRP